jgi:ferritin-like metal-binding protein YciE
MLVDGNVGRAERLISLAAGIGLLLTATRWRASALGRVTAGAVGLSLLTRGATGYCAFRGALAGESSLRDGFREQWSRIRSGLGGSNTEEIDSLHALYVAELQELHSAEAQLHGLLDELRDRLQNSTFARQIDGYATEVKSRREDLHRILRGRDADPREHSDQAMAALLLETRKLAQLRGADVREAALLASLQRVIHFKIAGYGTVATYAQLLGHAEEASRLAEYGDRDKQFDADLTETAQRLVNPPARTHRNAGEAGAEAATNLTY